MSGAGRTDCRRCRGHGECAEAYLDVFFQRLHIAPLDENIHGLAIAADSREQELFCVKYVLVRIHLNHAAEFPTLSKAGMSTYVTAVDARLV